MVKSKETRDAVLFLLPLGLVYGVFLYVPIAGVVLISLTEYDIIGQVEFVGLENFARFVTSERSLGIYATTFLIAIIVVTQQLIGGLILALSVSSIKKRYQGIFRTVFYTPVIITTASMAIAWGYMFNYNFGIINWAIVSLGFERVPWVTSSQYVIPSIAIFTFWKFVGNPFIYFYIGLQSISETYYEVAQIDGAGPWTRFRNITFPMLTPTMFFVVMILCINVIQMFDEPYFLTGGGPGDASRTINLHIYEVAFQRYDMGYSSALAVTLLVLLISLALVQTKLSKKWVTYDR